MQKETIIYDGEIQRIDQFLPAHFSYSRNFFHHIIIRGGIIINGKKIKKSYKLQNGDKIEIDNLQRYLSPLVLEESPKIEIPIVYETDDYIVIDKPKGVLAHPNSIRDAQKPSVVGFLYHKYKKLPSVGNFIRAGLVHRLDKDTDGFMIIAKTEKGLTYFKSLFDQKSLAKTIKDKENIKLKKKYTAVCEITKKGEKFLSRINNSLPYIIQENVISKTPNASMKMGITKILSVEKGEKNMQKKNSSISFDTSLHSEGQNIYKLIVEILTGRTHQIRYHLSNNGLPILNDYLYGLNNDPQGKTQLTASSLEFEDCYGEYKTFEKQ